MSLFAHECERAVKSLVAGELSVALGDTSSLAMRFGIHSGPVTAGVLRGEKSRFQLFGDTVNTGKQHKNIALASSLMRSPPHRVAMFHIAARMESTGQKGRIQLSQETADLLVKAGKGSWLEERRDMVEAKGKGTLQTYWLVPGRSIIKNRAGAQRRAGDEESMFNSLTSSLNSSSAVDADASMTDSMSAIVANHDSTSLSHSRSQDLQISPGQLHEIKENVCEDGKSALRKKSHRVQ